MGPSGPCTALEYWNCTGTVPLPLVSGTSWKTSDRSPPRPASSTGKSPHSSPVSDVHPRTLVSPVRIGIFDVRISSGFVQFVIERSHHVLPVFIEDGYSVLTTIRQRFRIHTDGVVDDGARVAASMDGSVIATQPI